jgi:formylglycine-generating enzyme required for sulfatase activity
MMDDRRVFGDYNIIKQIGQGPLGAVYLAEHRFMKNPYVLKMLPEELSSDRLFIQRFEEEVANLATIDHPNIIKMHNVSFDQGQYFLVMDCIVDELGETTNLAQYMSAKSNRLEEEELLHLLAQIADPLDYAHEKKAGGKGLAHRGIKLNNILVGKSKNGLNFYLSDFGLSRIIGMGALLTRTYKMVAETLGISPAVASPINGIERYPNPPIDLQKLTPLHVSFLQNYAFLAPEQKRLDAAKPVDIKADIYAFGVLVYYLLMGEFPEGLFEMPSDRNEGFKMNWDLLVCECLHADPSKRPGQLMPLLEAIKGGPDSYSSNTMQEHGRCQNKAAAKVCEDKEPAPLSENQSSAVETVAETQSLPAYKLAGSIQSNLSAGSFRPIIRTAQLEKPEIDPDPAAAFHIDNTVKHYKPEHKEIKNIQPLSTEMAVIPGNTFYRGSNEGNRDEQPRHEVHLNSFAIDVHPVTNEQFVRFLEAMGGEKDSNHHDIIRTRDSRIKRTAGKLCIESGYAKHPVVGVTWYGAIAYAKWVGKRLPTEAEWEIASRGGVENALYPTGDEIEKSQANFFSSDTIAVMSYASNGYGLYDIGGNVYEWCYDWYGYNAYEVAVQEPENPKGPLQGVYRVLRGGCWKSLKEDLRCSKRHRNNPGTVNGTYGFRCAADAQVVKSE